MDLRARLRASTSATSESQKAKIEVKFTTTLLRGAVTARIGARPRELASFPLLVGLALTGATRIAAAQSQPPFPDPVPNCPDVIYAFVDPTTGDDALDSSGNVDPIQAQTKLNNPASPFQTIQAAIDSLQFGLALHFSAGHPDAQGLVQCMPGIYGPTGAQARTDTLPIQMRDRVHLQGSGARRTVIRGDFDPFNAIPIFWPDAECCGGAKNKVVLVDFSAEGANVGGLPWSHLPNTSEMIDGFTFEGGHVQVLHAGEGDGLGRVSNCVFDLRAESDEPAMGPEIGILFTRTWDFSIAGYHSLEFTVLNNTFVFGEFSASSDVHLRPTRAALPWTVGILDTVNPVCAVTIPSDLCHPANVSPFGDPDIRLRGVSDPNIQNNLFRTRPDEVRRQVTLGIHKDDTSVAPGGGTAPGSTNAFNAAHVGMDFSTDAATIPTLFSALTSSAPVPRVNLGDPTRDPAFIGELIAPTLPLTLLNNLKIYRDWRLTPAGPGAPLNPLQNGGSRPNASGKLVAENGTVYAEPFCSEFWSFDWDGEGFGNPRVVGSEIDIGFDEVHMMLMAGSWANDSASHHRPDTVIDVNTTQVAGSRRFMIFPRAFAAAGNSVQINGTNQGYTSPPPSIPAWVIPPGASMPVNQPSLPMDFQTRYIPFTNPHGLTPWNGSLNPTALINPANGLVYDVGVMIRNDPDGGASATYFNAQPVLSLGGLTFFGNLQSEYR